MKSRRQPTPSQAAALERIANGGGIVAWHSPGGLQYRLFDSGGIPNRIVRALVEKGSLIAVDPGLYPEMPQTYRVRVAGDP
jgi:hypothetical protein